MEKDPLCSADADGQHRPRSGPPARPDPRAGPFIRSLEPATLRSVGKGRMLAGRYALGERLGAGTMGEVYAARDVDGTELAIKFLRDEVSTLPDIRERFQREATNARRIQSPHVARVVAAGASSRGLWIAYERLFGETLEDRLSRERVPPGAVTSSVVAQVLVGLAAAHAVDVIHRDIKPANIFLNPTPSGGVRACILDFGISKYRGVEAGTSLTGTADSLGSLRFAAPEQLGAAAEAQAPADLYAAGVVAFRMLTGAMPFAGKSATTMLVSKLNSPALTLEAVTGASWPVAMRAFLERALDREPRGRFRSATEMRDAWQVAVASSLPLSRTFDAKIWRDHDPDDFKAHEESRADSTARA